MIFPLQGWQSIAGQGIRQCIGRANSHNKFEKVCRNPFRWFGGRWYHWWSIERLESNQTEYLPVDSSILQRTLSAFNGRRLGFYLISITQPLSWRFLYVLTHLWWRDFFSLEILFPLKFHIILHSKANFNKKNFYSSKLMCLLIPATGGINQHSLHASSASLSWFPVKSLLFLHGLTWVSNELEFDWICLQMVWGLNLSAYVFALILCCHWVNPQLSLSNEGLHLGYGSPEELFQ